MVGIHHPTILSRHLGRYVEVLNEELESNGLLVHLAERRKLIATLRMQNRVVRPQSPGRVGDIAQIG